MNELQRLLETGKPVIRRATDAVRRQTGRPRSVRLTFSYSEDGIRLIARTRRLKPAPPSDPLDRGKAPTMIVADLRRADGRTVYRKRLRRAIAQDVEVFDPDGGIRRVSSAPARGTFSVIVPAGLGAELVIDAGPEAPLGPLSARRTDRQTGRATLGRFSVRE